MFEGFKNMFIPQSGDSEAERNGKNLARKAAGFGALAAGGLVAGGVQSAEILKEAESQNKKPEAIKQLTPAEQSSLQERGPGGATVAADFEHGNAVVNIPHQKTLDELSPTGWINPDTIDQAKVDLSHPMTEMKAPE